ncbi:hypothetical protein EIP91_006551 [Steccherinum ochraceum]|uniref:Uncharacterized protein n=1 Tax=Steccherinum ochraceum TaxID=92696 RepID=A0A4R0R5R7_9APHY|nr:hypothetical protein EIP91_006551 [Steccherinum ochraceum]
MPSYITATAQVIMQPILRRIGPRALNLYNHPTARLENVLKLTVTSVPVARKSAPCSYVFQDAQSVPLTDYSEVDFGQSLISKLEEYDNMFAVVVQFDSFEFAMQHEYSTLDSCDVASESEAHANWNERLVKELNEACAIQNTIQSMGPLNKQALGI